MKRNYLILFILFPAVTFAQNEVGPDGSLLLIILIVLVLLPLLFWGIGKLNKSKPNKGSTFTIQFKRLQVSLDKDRQYKPRLLTLRIENKSKKNIDLEAPVLHFRKLWTKRKFKLKGFNRQEIYPLYLEKGKTHELQIDLSVFHQHDKKLRKFFWAKIRFQDTLGRKYSSKRVTLRKSLFS